MNESFDESSLVRDELAKSMVGEIVLSSSPERVIRKWREIFKISQKELAEHLGITSSVISDYESGRRKSPGIKVIKKYVSALIHLDEVGGGEVTKSFAQTTRSRPVSEAVMDIKEFPGGVGVGSFCRAINARLVGRWGTGNEIYGYTIIDSVRAISELSFPELVKLYGITTQRALIFTKVLTGRTPLVAIKLTNLRPGLVVLHGPSVVDEVARNIADAEGVPLALCRLADVEGIKKGLAGLGD